MLSNVAEQCDIDPDIIRRLYENTEPNRKLIYSLFATLTVTSSITLILPYACGHFLDIAVLEAAGNNPGGKSSPFTVAFGLFGLIGAAGLGVQVYARSLMLNIAGNRIASRMRRQLLGTILAQEAVLFDTPMSGI